MGVIWAGADWEQSASPIWTYSLWWENLLDRLAGQKHPERRQEDWAVSGNTAGQSRKSYGYSCFPPAQATRYRAYTQTPLSWGLAQALPYGTSFLQGADLSALTDLSVCVEYESLKLGIWGHSRMHFYTSCIPFLCHCYWLMNFSSSFP